MAIHCARVYLTEAARRRAMGQRRFAATLQQWAANARRRAAAGQRDLFGNSVSPPVAEAIVRANYVQERMEVAA